MHNRILQSRGILPLLLAILGLLVTPPNLVHGDIGDTVLLQDRVAEELLREGTSLHRLGCRLQITQEASQLEIQLVAVDGGEVLAARTMARELLAFEEFEAQVALLTIFVSAMSKTLKTAPNKVETPVQEFPGFGGTNPSQGNLAPRARKEMSWRKSEQTDLWSERPWGVNLIIGAGGPAGFGGASLDRNFGSLFGIYAGLGHGTSWSTFAGVRFRPLKLHHYARLGLNVGLSNGDAVHYSPFSMENSEPIHLENSTWATMDLSAERRMGNNLLLRFTFGWTKALASDGCQIEHRATSSPNTMSPCMAGQENVSNPYLEFSLGYTF